MQKTAQDTTPLTTEGFAHPPRNVAALGIDRGMTVADFGSGAGAYVLAIAEILHNAGHVFAIDVQRDLLTRTLNEARKRGFNNVEIIWADLERARASKLGDQSLDVVLISNLLFQVEEKAAVLEEARRILRPHGRLVIIDWIDSFGGMGPHKSDIVTKETAQMLAEDAGFRMQREFAAGAHHYGLIFTRRI